MFDYDTVLEAMTDKDTVFFSTTYWDTMRVDCEYDQVRVDTHLITGNDTLVKMVLVRIYRYDQVIVDTHLVTGHDTLVKMVLSEEIPI